MDLNRVSIDDTLLQSGSPILIKQLDLLIYQPKLIEYSLNGGEEAMQKFIKIISLEPSLEDLENFPGIKELDIIYALVHNKQDLSFKNIFYDFFKIFIKDFNIAFDIQNEHAVLKLTHKQIETMPPLIINNLDFLLIKQYIETILYINVENEKKTFNPDSKKAEEIKAKLDKGNLIRQRIKNKNHSFLFNAISAFCVEQKLFLEDVYQKYTLYQFYTQYARMNSKLNYDISLQALTAGAKDVKVPDWQSSL